MKNKVLQRLLKTFCTAVEESEKLVTFPEPFESKEYEYMAFLDGKYQLIPRVEYSVLLDAKKMYLTRPEKETEFSLARCMDHSDPFKVLLSSLEAETMQDHWKPSFPVKLTVYVESLEVGHQMYIDYNFDLENETSLLKQLVFETHIPDDFSVWDATKLYKKMMRCIAI